MDVAIDQPGNEPLAMGIDHPCSGWDGHSPAAPAQRIRSPRTSVTAFATRAAPGAVPQICADNCDGWIWR